MADKLVSIIVPVYKVEKYLEQSVKSAVFQTYKNKEIILVDDGSPDNCGKMCDAFAEKYNNVKVIHQKNGGLSNARNSGIKKAKGDYLYFLDSDDCMHPEMIETLVNELNNSDCDYVECSYYNIEDDENPSFTHLKKEKCFDVVFPEMYNNMLRWKVNFPMVWTKLYRKETFNEIKFEEGKIQEDEFLMTALAPTLNKVRVIPIPMYCYRQRGGSIMSTAYSKKRTAFFDSLIERYYKLLKRNKRVAYNQLTNLVSSFYHVITLMQNNTQEEKEDILKFLAEKVLVLEKEISTLPKKYLDGIILAKENPKELLQIYTPEEYPWLPFKD